MRAPPGLSEQNITSMGLLSKRDLLVHKTEKLWNRSVPWCQLDSSSSLSSSSLHIGHTVGENIALERIQLFFLLVAIALGLHPIVPTIPAEREYFSPAPSAKGCELVLLVLIGLTWVVGFCLIPAGMRGRSGGYSLTGQSLFNMCSPLKLTRSPWASW